MQQLKTFKYLTSISLLVLSLNCVAQYDSLYADSTWYKTRFKPTGVRVGVDLVSFGQGVVSNGLSALTQGEVRQWKFNADIDFYRYFLNLEFGQFDRVWLAPESTYINEGTFFKIGPDINFLHRDPDQSALFIGFRYARANYEDLISFSYANSFWQDGSGVERNSSLSSRWFELTTGLKVKLSKFIWTGYTARFKFSVNDNHTSNDLIPHWIPGYGFAQEESQWGLEYWLIFRLPIGKYIPAPKKDN